MKNLVVRTLSGLVLAAVVLGAIVWSQWSFGALLAVLLVGGMYEFYTLAGKQGNAPQRVVGLVAGIVLFALNLAFVSDDIREILGVARQAFGCGVRILATIHAGSAAELREKPLCRAVLGDGMFEQVLFLDNNRAFHAERIRYAETDRTEFDPHSLERDGPWPGQDRPAAAGADAGVH